MSFACDYDNDIYTSDTKGYLKYYILWINNNISLISHLLGNIIPLVFYQPGEGSNLLCFLCGLSSESFLATEE